MASQAAPRLAGEDVSATRPRPGPPARSQPVTSLAEQYARLARETPGRAAVDFELRVLDVFFSGLFLLLFLPIAAVIAALILATSGRPLFYRGERVGRGGRVFTMTKFRTLRPGAEARIGRHLGPALVEHTDSEVTRVGRRLRATQLDEIPQLWNVFKGDMSLVGPRPIRPLLIEEFRQSIPRYMLRHRVKAGMTGWAQVHGWRGNTSLEQRLEHDLYYVQHWSLFLDIKILWMTLWRGFVHKNAY